MRERARHFANLAAQPRVVAVHLDADEAVLLDAPLHHVAHPAAVARGMDEGQPIEAVRPARDDARDLAVRDRIVGMKRRKDDRAVDAGPGGPAQVLFKRRRGVPGTGQPIAFSGMAMAVDDHEQPSRRHASVGAKVAGCRAAVTASLAISSGNGCWSQCH